MNKKFLGATVLVIAVVLLVSIGGRDFITTNFVKQNKTESQEKKEWHVYMEPLVEEDMLALGIDGDVVSMGSSSFDGDISISNLNIQNIRLMVRSPEDRIEYYFKIINDGDYNARLADIKIADTGQYSKDWINKNTSFRLEYRTKNNDWEQLTKDSKYLLAEKKSVYVRAVLIANNKFTSDSSKVKFPAKNIAMVFKNVEE